LDWEAWLTLAVVVVTIAVLVAERLSPTFAVLGAVVTLLVTGIIEPEEAFSGFSNPAPITVAALYVLAAGVQRTGALEGVASALLRDDKKVGSSGPMNLTRVLFPTAAASAFLNNTTIVAMVAPAVLTWARRTGRSPSPYLMPLSFAAILGGVVTLIGTSTNLVVSGLLTEAGEEPLGLFEIGRAGLPIAVIGLIMLVLAGPRLLPVRRSPSEEYRGDAREYTVEMVVSNNSPLDGKTVSEGGLRSLQGVFLIEIERDDRRIAPVQPSEVLAGGDRLIFAGNVNRIVDLQRIPGLNSAEERHYVKMDAGPHRRFFEAVVAEGSPLAGSTLKDAGFRGNYGGAVVAVHRAGERVPGKLGEVRLRPGDVLLILAETGFRRRWRTEPDFLIVAPLDGGTPPRREKAPVVGVVLLAVLGLAATGLMDILDLSLLAALALVLFGVLTPSQARNAVDLDVIVLIAASFGLGAALQTSGLAETIASGLISAFDPFGDVGLLLGVLLATILLTEMITNNAAAVLMFPIAFATSTQAGLDPRGFAIAVAIGASASFLSPIGYQTNTMVYGMGGYRFTDFFRLGFPLTIVMVILAVIFIPLSWPL
jgi:di/tricarboxylate transporter